MMTITSFHKKLDDGYNNNNSCDNDIYKNDRISDKKDDNHGKSDYDESNDVAGNNT